MRIGQGDEGVSVVIEMDVVLVAEMLDPAHLPDGPPFGLAIERCSVRAPIVLVCGGHRRLGRSSAGRRLIAGVPSRVAT